MRPARFIALSALLSLFAPAATASVRDAGNEFLVAYGTGDVAALRSMWSGKTADDALRFQSEVAQTLRVKCLDLFATRIDSIAEEGNAATVHGTVIREESFRNERPSPRVVAKHVDVRFGLEDGRWRVTGFALTEAGFAERLMSEVEASGRLLMENLELLNADLLQALYDVGNSGKKAGKNERERTAAIIAHRAAGLLGDPSSRAVALLLDAGVADTAGDLPRMEQLLEEARAVAREGDDPVTLIRILLLTSTLYERLPDAFPKAIASGEQAVALEDRLDQPFLLSKALSGLGLTHLKMGNHAAAVPYYERAAKVAAEIGDKEGFMYVAVPLGIMAANEGNYELALHYLQQAYDVGATSSKLDLITGQGLVYLSDGYQVLGRMDDAREALRKSGQIGARLGEPIIIGATHRSIGSLLRRTGHLPEAAKELEEALEVLRKAHRNHLIPPVLSELALARLDSGDAKEAAARADDCATFSQKMTDDPAFVECRTIGGRAHRAMGDVNGALAEFREAIDTMEDLRGMIVGDLRQRARFLERSVTPYVDAADLLAQRGDVEAGLQMAERAKGRVLLDVLHTEAERTAITLTADEARRERESSEKLAAASRRLREAKSKATPDAAEARNLTAEATKARTEYEELQIELDVAHPRWRTSHGDVAVASLRELDPLLGSSLAVVEYMIADDHTRVFVITRQHVETFTLPIGERELDRRVSNFSAALAKRNIEYRAAAQALFTALLHPLERALRGRKALCIVPDGALWRLPFEALIDGQGRFVIESRSCFYAPSISVLAEVMRRHDRGAAEATLLAVGNPALPAAMTTHLRSVYRDVDLGPLKEAEDEVRTLRTLYGARNSRMYVGAAATKTRVRAEIEKYQIIHFATHGIFDEENPLESQVVLAPDAAAHDDGLLGASEIMRLKLRADIAVLSACETGRGHVAAGEGVIGFTWALFVAGCPSSVVSQWKVDSASTSRLMVDFHRQLLAGPDAPLAKADALRSAKLAMLKRPARRHPFYWAAFVLVGSPAPIAHQR
jgi:CHAT domain-containing protein